MKEWEKAYWESARATKGIKVPGLGEPTALDLAREINALLHAGRVSQKMHLLRTMSDGQVQKMARKERSCTTT